MPDLFDSSADFQTWFGLEKFSGDGEDADLLSEEESLLVTNRLHQVLRPFILRRLKSTVATDLPRKTEHLVPCTLSPYERALYGFLLSELETGTMAGVRNAYMEMRAISNHPFISRLHVDGGDLPSHPLPDCLRLGSKLEVLDGILRKMHATGHKVLLFCTMTRMMDVLEDYLEWRGFQYLRLDGSTQTVDRQHLLTKFNKKDSSIFLFILSTRAGGVGLNLQAADTVIMYDTDPNPQIDLQAQARAHRIGQTRPVMVIRLHAIGTIEDDIISRAMDRRGLADRSITGGFFDGSTSAEARRGYLLHLIRTVSTGPAERSVSSLNETLARTPAEVIAFDAEDDRCRSMEEGRWKNMGTALCKCPLFIFARGVKKYKMKEEKCARNIVNEN
ncbi:hypothetical protein BSKO_10983 [Bryopsis sp. KO-2023]|nr:hypothetical protein BSKO_10983 [Bryopsis sp. KO-2023]